MQKTQKIRIMSFALVTIYLMSILSSLPITEAHVLVVGDVNNYNEALSIGNKLKSEGYNVLELYKENATSKNIIKGMYNADAIIYLGHGGYMPGSYDENGGTAKPPFSIIGTENSNMQFIWGIDDKMKEGKDGNLFTPPYKDGIPVILLHTCFSAGWSKGKEISNPTESIYSFSKMFRAKGANYYATGYPGSKLIDSLLNGDNFASANKQNYEVIKESTKYNGTQIWRNTHGNSAFVGDWDGKFPKAAQTTPYDDNAAEEWYNNINHSKNQDTVVQLLNPLKAILEIL